MIIRLQIWRCKPRGNDVQNCRRILRSRTNGESKNEIDDQLYVCNVIETQFLDEEANCGHICTDCHADSASTMERDTDSLIKEEERRVCSGKWTGPNESNGEGLTMISLIAKHAKFPRSHKVKARVNINASWVHTDRKKLMF